jgi:hypothetical protein
MDSVRTVMTLFTVISNSGGIIGFIYSLSIMIIMSFQVKSYHIALIKKLYKYQKNMVTKKQSIPKNIE